MQQLRDLGAPPDVIEAVEGSIHAVPDDEGFEVWEENWPSLQVFLRLESQWNVAAGMTGLVYVGLKYETIPFELRCSDIPESDQKSVYRDLQVMERAAKTVLNNREK